MNPEQWQTRLWRRCFHFTKNRDLAADLAQDVALASYKHMRKKGEMPTIAWMLNSARFMFLDRLKKQKVRGVSNVQDITNTPQIIDDELESREMREQLKRAIRKLPANYQAVLVRCYYEEASTAHVAAEMGQSEATIRKWRSRAIQLLKNFFVNETLN